MCCYDLRMYLQYLGDGLDHASHFVQKVVSVIFIFLIAFFAMLFFDVDRVHASGHTAELVGELPELQIMPFQEKQVTLQFLNTGSRTWTKTGPHYSSLYTDPSTRNSKFSYHGWFGKGQPALMQEDRVAPGEVGTFVLPLMAPGEEGEYLEKFKVALEDVAWVKGSYITLPITVTRSPKIENVGEGLSANLLMKSHEELEVAGGEVVQVRLGVKNVGPRTWKQVKVIEPGVALATTELASIFHDNSWPEGRVALAMGAQEFKTGQLALLSVPVRAPGDVGEYTLRLQMTAEGENIGGAYFELPVTVTTPAPEEINAEPLPVIQPWMGVAEPRFRVGVGSVPDAAIVDVNQTYRIVDGNGLFHGEIRPSEGAEWFYDEATDSQTFVIMGIVFKTDSYFRLEPTDADTGVVTISSIEDRARWNRSINYNQFRDTIEMRRNSVGYTWMVNELPIEYYVQGLAEVSNSWPMEMHKAQIIAARSFALYYHERGGKHRSSGSSYSLNSSSYDQVYKGYAAELHNPNVVAAARATRGEVVRYEGNTAMTTYFARSDGRTRSFSDAWGGSGRPYLVPRIAEYDQAKGNRRWGHGVGMSQTDGAMRADAGATYDQILHAYYTGVTIDRVYE